MAIALRFDGAFEILDFFGTSLWAPDPKGGSKFKHLKGKTPLIPLIYSDFSFFSSLSLYLYLCLLFLFSLLVPISYLSNLPDAVQCLQCNVYQKLGTTKAFRNCSYITYVDLFNWF